MLRAPAPVTPSENRRIIRRLAIGLPIAILIAFGAVALQAHRAADQLVDNQRDGCERSTQDRYELSKALAALAGTGDIAAAEPGISPTLAQHRQSAADGFRAVAESLRSRTRATLEGRREFCADAFPAPPILP